MRSRIYFLGGAVFLGMMLGPEGLGEAQMINYQRRARRQGLAVQQKAVPPAKTEEKDSVQAMLASNPAATNRVERIYDANKDGYLQETEIKEYLADVVSTVRRRGRASVSSSILKVFDKNGDGVITRYEVGAIKKVLR